jgi:alkylation response protein AidB-like acyl-CoA dehydrogenase
MMHFSVMMDFHLSPEQRLLHDSLAKLAQKHLAADALKRAHARDYPWQAAQLLAANGALGLTVSEADGGQGGSLMDAVLAIEAVAAACPRSADVVQAGNFGPIRVLAEYGTPSQKARYLKRLLAGEGVISVGMTEPEAGSAVTDLRTTATPDAAHPGAVRINGTKVFTSHAWYADVILAYVRFGPGVGGIGSVLIDTKAPGVRFGEPTAFMSGEEWAQVYFDDVLVMPEDIVLREGGFKKQIAGFNVERIGNATRSLALGRYAFNVAREWALQRKQFGKLLCEFQGIQWKFADMKLKLDAAQLLLYRAASAAAGGIPSADDTATAKLACNLAGFEVANEAMQVMGGSGYSQDSLVEYCVRRCRGWMIAGGSVEILKNRVAEGVFGRSFPQRADV